MKAELERFVESLAIPADRKVVVLAELADHVACATEAAVREGRDPDAAARAAIGDLDVLRRSLEGLEPAFAVTRKRAMARGLVAGVLVAIVVDQFGTAMMGTIAALVAIAIAVVFAPPRHLDLLRAEFCAPRIRGALGFVRAMPIGPAVTYMFTVMCTPFAVWIGMILVRARPGTTTVDVPWSAFAVMTAGYALLLVEKVRARRREVA